MKCNPQNLLLLAADELPQPQLHDLQRHLDHCPACAAELARLRRDLDQLDRLPHMEPSAFAIQRVRDAARKLPVAHAAPRTALRPPFFYRYRFALAAAAGLALIISWSVIQSLMTPNQPVTVAPAQPVASGPAVRLWSNGEAELVNGVSEMDSLAENLEVACTEGPWADAHSQVIANIAPGRVGNELLDLEGSLQLLEAELAEGS